MTLSLAIAVVPVSLAGPAIAEDWTGFYAGGQLGMLDVEYPDSSPLIPGGVLFDGNGSVVGLHAGYNHDFGTFVLGAEVSLDFPSINLNRTLTGTPSGRDIDRITMAKIKAGYDAGNFLPYAVIGYASQKFDDGTAVPPIKSFDGMAYGFGADFQAGEKWIVGVEAMWFDLDPSIASLLTSKGSIASLRLSYRF